MRFNLADLSHGAEGFWKVLRKVHRYVKLSLPPVDTYIDVWAREHLQICTHTSFYVVALLALGVELYMQFSSQRFCVWGFRRTWGRRLFLLGLSITSEGGGVCCRSHPERAGKFPEMPGQAAGSDAGVYGVPRFPVRMRWSMKQHPYSWLQASRHSADISRCLLSSCLRHFSTVWAMHSPLLMLLPSFLFVVFEQLLLFEIQQQFNLLLNPLRPGGIKHLSTSNLDHS